MALALFLLLIALSQFIARDGREYRQQKRIEAINEENAVSEEEIKEIAYNARKQEYIRDLKRQGYSDEIITTILPTIMNDGRS